MKIQFRNHLDGLDSIPIFISSVILGLYVGGAVSVLSLCVSSGAPWVSDSFILTIVRIFSAFFAAGFAFSVAAQLLSPVIYHLPGYRSNDTEEKITAVIALLIAGGAAFGVFSIWENSAQARKAPYIAHLSEYLAEPVGKDEHWDGRVAGKVMTVDTEAKGIDDLYLQVNADYQPQKPEEVGTVVWLKWGKESTVRGTANFSAYRQTCDVTIIDLARRVVLARQSFTGEHPIIPSHGAANSSFYGNKPIAEIVAFIQGFPHR